MDIIINDFYHKDVNFLIKEIKKTATKNNIEPSDFIYSLILKSDYFPFIENKVSKLIPNITNKAKFDLFKKILENTPQNRVAYSCFFKILESDSKFAASFFSSLKEYLTIDKLQIMISYMFTIPSMYFLKEVKENDFSFLFINEGMVKIALFNDNYFKDIYSFIKKYSLIVSFFRREEFILAFAYSLYNLNEKEKAIKILKDVKKIINLPDWYSEQVYSKYEEKFI